VWIFEERVRFNLSILFRREPLLACFEHRVLRKLETLATPCHDHALTWSREY